MAAAIGTFVLVQSNAAMQAMSHDRIFNKIQEVLPDCIASDDIEPFLDIFEGKVSEPVKVYVETAVRYYVMKSLCKKDDTDLSKITAVAKLTTALTRKEVCLPTLPMLVLSDTFDALTVQQCERLFSFVESNVAVWKEPIFFTPSKNQVLRMCNDVLRRLSRSQNTIFCGRILLFLARFFPFSERSGLNLISEFNLENITTFSSTEPEEGMEVVDAKEEGDEEVKDIKEDKEKDAKDTKPALDYTLYTKFWALQDFFRNPVQCYQKGPWNMFTMYATDVLEAFSSFKLEDEGGAEVGERLPRSYTVAPLTEDGDCDQTIIDCLPDVKKIDQYFAKFLTNQRLLDLQFSDSNFRRYVLVQLLVLCHYLTAAIKFRQETLGVPETAWVHATEQRVLGLLRETPPDGDVFVEIVNKILARENLWNEWKNNGCPEIKKPVLSAENGVASEGDDTAKRGRKRKLGDLIREADSKNKFVMANAEMTRLWNLCPDNVMATRQKKRDFIPSLDQYFTRAVQQVQALDEVPVAERLVNDGNFGWRGLRILACRSPHFFTHSTAPIATLPEYLTTMIKKLAKDLPQPPQTQQQRQQLNQAEESKQQDEEEKMIPDQSEEAVNCVEEEDEEEAQAGGELQPLTKQEQVSLAANLARLPTDQWKSLFRKMGFQDDEVGYILDQQKGNVADCATHFLQLWVENEGDEANRETILYTLEGLKLQVAANGVFT